MPLRYSVIEVPHHPGSCRRNLSGSKTYHVISLERRPSSPNSDATQSDALCRAAEQLGRLVGRVAGGQAFEGVPLDGVGRTGAVRREVAREQAALGAERAMQVSIGLVGARQLLRRRRRLVRVEVEHAEQHAEPAELDDDVLALAEFGDACLPRRARFIWWLGRKAGSPADCWRSPVSKHRTALSWVPTSAARSPSPRRAVLSSDRR